MGPRVLCFCHLHREKDAQFEYEQFMKDSSEKHAADAKAISVKESVKAETEAAAWCFILSQEL